MIGITCESKISNLSIMKILFIAILLSLFSCAGSYKTMKASDQSFIDKQSINDSLLVGYKYDIYSQYGNKRYSKKEKVHGYKLLAIEITNQSNEAIKITKDNFKLSIGGADIPPADLDIYTRKVKQESATYLLHALWGPWTIKKTVQNGKSNTTVKYLPIGAGIGLINTMLASSANAKHMTNINSSIIWGKTISPKSKLYGFVCIRNQGYDQITFKYLY